MKLIEVKKAAADFLAILNILQEDWNMCAGALQEDPSNFWLRSYIRTSFALVEGTNFGLKQIALKMHEFRPCFDEAELCLLAEISYEMTANGNTKVKNKHIDLISNIKFTAKCVDKAFCVSHQIEFDGTGWQKFRDALSIRHQITHPKTAHQLLISDEDNGRGAKVDIIMEGSGWYVQYLQEMCQLISSSVRKLETKDVLTDVRTRS